MNANNIDLNHPQWDKWRDWLTELRDTEGAFLYMAGKESIDDLVNEIRGKVKYAGFPSIGDGRGEILDNWCRIVKKFENMRR